MRDLTGNSALVSKVSTLRRSYVTTVLGNVPGPIANWQGFFMANGGRILISYGASGFVSRISLTAFYLILDSAQIALTETSFFFNQAATHHTFPTVFYDAGVLIPGSHSVSLIASSGLRADYNDM